MTKTRRITCAAVPITAEILQQQSYLAALRDVREMVRKQPIAFCEDNICARILQRIDEMIKEKERS